MVTVKSEIDGGLFYPDLDGVYYPPDGPQGAPVSTSAKSPLDLVARWIYNGMIRVTVLPKRQWFFDVHKVAHAEWKRQFPSEDLYATVREWVRAYERPRAGEGRKEPDFEFLPAALIDPVSERAEANVGQGQAYLDSIIRSQHAMPGRIWDGSRKGQVHSERSLADSDYDSMDDESKP